MYHAQTLMATEAAAKEGYIPETIPNALTETVSISLSRSAFLFNLPSGLRFHYVQGRGVRFSRPNTVQDAEVRLFLNGSVYGAIAWINGLVPLHASAVVQDGMVHAFTGDSGAGKSTLAAALSARGLPLFADDVLVLDLQNNTEVMALPGHKQLKLWADAIELTKLTPGERVSSGVEKFFVEAPVLCQSHSLPITDLYFLDNQAYNAPILSSISGVDCFKLMRSALYRPEFAVILANKEDLFTQISRLVSKIAVSQFTRSKNRDLFNEGADYITTVLREKSTGNK